MIKNYNFNVSEEEKRQILNLHESIQNLKQRFNEIAAPGVAFGSAWVWLCLNVDTKLLEIVTTQNQDNPVMHNVNVITSILCFALST